MTIVNKVFNNKKIMQETEGTPDGSETNNGVANQNGVEAIQNDGVVNEQAFDDALKNLIAQQVSNALRAFTSQLPVAPPIPTPNQNTLENPRSGLVHSGTGGTLSESRDGKPGSSVNIILLRVLSEMQEEDRLVPKAHTLSDFDNSSVVTKGEVTLTTFAEGVVKETKFQVVEMEMAYNIILGRPWIHEMDVVPSTLHQVMKFPSPWGIRQIRGDQQTSRSINFVADSNTKK
ncbi:PREDICTED: uncharacterized protein LOC109234907 [Nicotiana attenuata]|uniref:uncharacterized protein LOC109234907 n=1 Tax=Nicotiana attenuata TaxID=49451 RepID=UPI0009057F9B|nr:PREDICTED: uncharacterized protein LOC109234907 [Nicotiana attenuata]